METQWLPVSLVVWITALAGTLDARQQVRFVALCTGLLFARGRRTVASWLRACGAGRDYKRYYYLLGSVGRKALAIAGALLRILLSAVYLRVAGANNSIVRDARVFLASPWSRRRLTMGPYSMDLRERVAAAIDEGEGSERQIAKRFRVSVSFVTRLLQRRRDAGTLAPKPHGGGPRPVLGFPEQVRLAMLIAEHPDATLNQLKEWGGFACTPTTIWRTLRRFRQTYKKKILHARERDDPKVQAKRRRYRREVEQIDAKRLVFVDET